MGDRVTTDITPPTLFHAVSQGALAVEIRADDTEAIKLCAMLTHKETQWRCTAERACLRVLEGGCSVPVGVASKINLLDGKEVLTLTGCVTALNGETHVEHTLEGIIANVDDAEKLGEKLAKVLVENGARQILDDINKDRDRRVEESLKEEKK